MSITSNLFFIFVIAGALVYYLLPRRCQMPVLLVMNILFYVSYGIKEVIFIILSIFITYFSAVAVGKIQAASEGDNEVFPVKEALHRSRRVLTLAVILNLGILGVLKYTDFVIDNINILSGLHIAHFDFLLPLGISYYTFQSIGYIVDVYWKHVKPERNFFKLAVFLSFFPYMIQGPINRYGTLAYQLYEAHEFTWNNLRYGLLRILWGLFKIMVLAGWAAIYADPIFADPDRYAGIAGFGVLLYTVELYANFSGGIDVVIGVARLFGIQMDENFRRPFFSASIGEFWRRWHITLGAWMKDYVMFPLTMSHGMKQLGKKTKKKFGKKTGRNIPSAISTLVVFFLVGLWHGASWGYIGWGMYNGVIIVVSIFLADLYGRQKKILHINDRSRGWHVFSVLRTFVLINLSWYLFRADSASTAFKMMKYTVTRFEPSLFLTISSGKLGTAYTPAALMILALGCAALFTVSFLQERGLNFDKAIAKKAPAVQTVIFVALFLTSLMFGPMASGKGFIYAQF